MVVKLLSEKELSLIPRTNIVDFILGGLEVIEKDISLNSLSEDVSLAWQNAERKIQLINLIRLFKILTEECAHDPQTGRILIDVSQIIEALLSLQKTFETGDAARWLIAVKKQALTQEHTINISLKKIITHLEEWKHEILQKITLPLGNAHTRDTYHPEFPETYSYLPSILPPDYRSNFFFEIHLKELCPYLTSFIFHSYKHTQAAFQETQTIEQLRFVNVHVDLQDEFAIETQDNIRALRVHGPSDDKRYPGSYLFIRRGHHRTRELYKRYLEGKVSGEMKILVQKISLKDFPADFLTDAKKEIQIRESLRLQLTKRMHT